MVVFLETHYIIIKLFMRIASCCSCLCSVALLINSAISMAKAEPVINEFMASNLSTYPDNCDFEDYSDWIELYTPASTNV